MAGTASNSPARVSLAFRPGQLPAGRQASGGAFHPIGADALGAETTAPGAPVPPRRPASASRADPGAVPIFA